MDQEAQKDNGNVALYAMYKSYTKGKLLKALLTQHENTARYAESINSYKALFEKESDRADELHAQVEILQETIIKGFKDV